MMLKCRRQQKGQGLATQEHTQEVSIKSLLEAGSHYGHQQYRWNPKMRRFVFEKRNGLYIIDLSKTLTQIKECLKVVREVVASNKSILFVGTKKQAKEVLKDSAERADEFHVCERWLGGMLTNLKTIRESIKKMDRFERQLASNDLGFKKKEIINLEKNLAKLSRNLSGIRSMRKLPGLIIIVDPKKEHIAVKEANKLGIPVMALVDTNCDPDPIQQIIACNDDALKSIRLIVGALTEEIIKTKQEKRVLKVKDQEETDRKKEAPKEEKKDTPDTEDDLKIKK